MTPAQLKAAFHAKVSEDFLFDWVALLRQIYKEAYTAVYAEYPKSEAHDLVGHVRRAQLEVNVRRLVSGQPDMLAIAYSNEQRTQNYTEIRAGNVVMTQSCLRFYGQVPRPANFRDELNRTLQHTFEAIRPDMVLQEGAVFAMLIHGPMPDDWHIPAFAHVAFPSVDFRRWVATIELLKAYSPQIKAARADTEVIEDQSTPNLRPQEEQEEQDEGSGIGT